MEAQTHGEAWESAVGDLRLRRTVESIEVRRVLVRMTFENDSETALRVRVLEEVPASVDEGALVTSAGGDPQSWRLIGDWIVHEVRIPGNQRRKTAYFLELDPEIKPTLPTPRVERVEHVSAEGAAEREAKDRNSGESSILSTGTALVSSETSDQSTDASLVDALCKELDAAPGEKRQELKAELALTPSETARFEHLRTRLENLAAYVDALEVLIDDHGVDVIETMQDRIDWNEERTAALEAEVSDLEEALEDHRTRTVDRFDSLEADLAEQGARLGSRITELEEDLEDTRTEIETVRAAHREERQSRARELRDVEESLVALKESLDALEDSVIEFERFHDRFTAAFTVDHSAGDHGSNSDSLQESAQNP